MKRLAVLSDSHDDLGAVRRARRLLEARGVGTVIHCGDITSPGTVSELGGLDVHWVFGNCDLHRGGLAAAMEREGHTCHGTHGVLELEGVSLAFTHGDRPELLRELLDSGDHRAVLHGHTHLRERSTPDGILLLCPGALAHAEPPGFAILTLPGLRVEWVEV